MTWDFTRKVNDMPWTKRDLPSYRTVETWFRQAHNSMNFYSFVFDRNIFQFWTKEYVESLAREILARVGTSQVLEVCAGDGCLTHWLIQQGVNAVATDNYEWIEDKKSNHPIEIVFPPVERLDAIEAVRKYSPRMTVASWIPYGSDIDWKILNLQVESLITIGEAQGGCCGSEKLWEEYEKLGYGQEELECDRWNLCRTDYSFMERHIQQHSLTALFYKPKQLVDGRVAGLLNNL